MDWGSIIHIDKSWPSDVLNHHFTEMKDKIIVCLHSVSSSGSQVRPDTLVNKLAQLMPEFVLGRKAAQELGNPMDISFRSCQYFGDTDPEKDGKYGELLLFALVEALLGCKMVAHKVRALTSMNDQVKGGDGVFLGNYKTPDDRKMPAYLIGESKVVANLSQGLSEAFSSIYRVHDSKSSYLFREAEWIVAKDHLLEDEDVDVDELYNRLNPDTTEFKQQTLVHPILIMYNSKEVSENEKISTTKEEFEQKLADSFAPLKYDLITRIQKQLEQFPEVQTVFLHFFMIPFNNVSAFRNSMYQRIHNGTYRPKVKKHPKKARKKDGGENNHP